MKKLLTNSRFFYFTINLIFVTLLALSSGKSSWSQEPLKLGVHPYLSYIEIETKFAPLVAYLSAEIGRPIVVRVGSSYQEHIDAIGRDQLDFAYIGPAVYVSMVDKYGSKPLIVCQDTNGSPSFKGIIIVRDDNPATGLADLGEGEFAFVDPHSTMGYLIPMTMLQHENPLIIANQHYQFLKTHKNVALGVLSGDFEAGAVKEEIYHKFKPQGLKILAATPAIAEHLFIASNKLSNDLVKQIRMAMLKLNKTQINHNVLKSIKTSITGFSLVEDDAYNSLRMILGKVQKRGLLDGK